LRKPRLFFPVAFRAAFADAIMPAQIGVEIEVPSLRNKCGGEKHAKKETEKPSCLLSKTPHSTRQWPVMTIRILLRHKI
jgi:hypothetical protein